MGRAQDASNTEGDAPANGEGDHARGVEAREEVEEDKDGADEEGGNGDDDEKEEARKDHVEEILDEGAEDVADTVAPTTPAHVHTWSAYPVE